ncbi:hypothetical protein [Rhizobium leguminosarum]|uniref:hypothetical protein n=1 Tax=Rhizobium leguminosarum TaxID=384 RepID=UPI001FDF1D58|nr:hypothetical protein [Rhizobium leguminosarum]
MLLKRNPKSLICHLSLANGGSLGGCTQQQGFNLFNLIVTPAYADGFATDCTIRQRDGQLIHLGIKSYQDCQDAIYAYLNTIDTEKRSDILRNAGFAFVVDHPLDVESWVKGDWLLDAIRKLDGGDPDGANAKAYAQGQYAAALLADQLRGERWEILQDTSISWSLKVDRLEATGLDMNAIIAMAMIGIAANGGRPIAYDGQFYSADGFKFSKAYYERLWSTGGRPAPFLQARAVLDSNPKISADPRGAPGYFRYEGAGLEMIYNPTTGQVGHIQPLR